MKGDFARVTFDPTRHYSQVFQQQGRVLLEADWNEQGNIQLHLLRSLIRDLLGPCWAAGTGFALTGSTTDPNGTVKPLPLTDWRLAPGHFYVDGILCENEALVTLAAQPYRPTPDYGVSGTTTTGFENPSASYALYLDVWERHLSAAESPAISDVALNGVDTCSRAQVVWQLRMLSQAQADQQLDGITAALDVRLQASTDATTQAAINQQLLDVRTLRDGIDGNGNANTNDDPCVMVRQLLGARGTWALPRLSAKLGPVESDNDPCVIAADASYRGCENQLYRVEIHQGGPAGVAGAASAASFKWSRENGSVVFPVAGSIATTTLADGSTQLVVPLARLGRDARLGLVANDWVELVDDNYTLGQRAYPLLLVVAVDVANCAVTLAAPRGGAWWPLSSDQLQHPLLRRWDQRAGVNTQGVLAVIEGATAPITLEDGIQITFEPGGLYATGEYWLIPARVIGNDHLGWPQVTAADGSSGPVALPPRGLHHSAVLGVSDDGDYHECCCRFDSLCAQQQASAIGSGKQSAVVDARAVAVPASVKKVRKGARATKKSGANEAKSG
ncbi:MAG TPA: DUF6519 domain-containing protein [Rhodanobacter sp.]|nr:DUF6519 domain-containing protein [Rhodanobacter sp.]